MLDTNLHDIIVNTLAAKQGSYSYSELIPANYHILKYSPISILYPR